MIPSGDFSLYDHVLGTAWALGAIPPRFGDVDRDDLADYSLDQIDPASIPPTSRRAEIFGASGLNVLLGLWLIVSPFVLGYNGADSFASDVFAGIVITSLAAGRDGEHWSSWMSWTNMVVGLWVLGSAFWLADLRRLRGTRVSSARR